MTLILIILVAILGLCLLERLDKACQLLEDLLEGGEELERRQDRRAPGRRNRV